MEALALIAGALIGTLLSLVPGLHVALVLTLLVAAGIDRFVGPLPALLFIAAAAGASIYARRLGQVYHPSASDPTCSEPALRMTREGRGAEALQVMLAGTDIAWVPFGLAAIAIGLSALVSFNLVRAADGFLAYFGLPLIAAWALWTCWKSARPFLTAIGFVVVGMFGYFALHHPTITGSTHALAPVLAGVFALPLMAQVLLDRSTGGLPVQHPPDGQLRAQVNLAWNGAVLGSLTGLFAGLGSSSLVSLADGNAQGDEDYLILGAAGESANDLVAVLMWAAIGAGRSGEAVLLGQVAPRIDGFTAVAALASLAIGAYVGRTAVQRLGFWYARVITSVPAFVWAALVVLFSLAPVVLAGRGTLTGVVIALGITAIGFCCSTWARACRLPIQVSFAALTVPIVLSAAGLVPVLNGLLF